MESIFESAIQLGATACAAAAAYLSFKQCKLMKAQLDGDRYLRQNEKSIELAKLFADSIIPKSTYITEALRLSRCARDIKGKLKSATLSEFTEEEIHRIVGYPPKKAIAQIVNDLSSEPAITGLLAARTKLSLAKPEEAYPLPPEIFNEPMGDSEENEGSEEEAKPAQKHDARTALAKSEFSHVASNTLHCLEYFCMAINAGVADDEVLYPSLHQVFFSTVESLYFFICSQNNGSAADRYFTHVTDLYVKWEKRCEEDRDLLRSVEKEVRERYETKKRDQLR